MKVDFEQQLLFRVAVEEMKPQTLRSCAGKIDRVTSASSDSSPEGHQSFQTRVGEAPADTRITSRNKIAHDQAMYSLVPPMQKGS